MPCWNSSRPKSRLSNELVPDGEYLTNGIVETNPFEVITNMEGKVASALDSIEVAGTEVEQAGPQCEFAAGDE